MQLRINVRWDLSDAVGEPERMRFFSFYTSDFSRDVVNDHIKCCKLSNIELTYHIEPEGGSYDDIYTAHGDFMTEAIVKANDDVVCFLDVDCLPYDFKVIKTSYDWVKNNNSFAGNAQNISHTVMRNRIYAAASMMLISKQAWLALDKPSFSWFYDDRGRQIDTAQLISLRADEVGMPYKLMFPIGYDGPNAWDLGSYGRYGTGTLYPASWHYFRISEFKDNIPKLWDRRVKNILRGEHIIPNFPSPYYAMANQSSSLEKLFSRFRRR